METITNILRIFEAIALVTGLVCWKKVRYTYWKWFLVYLLFIVTSECIGAYLNDIGEEVLNQKYFNYFEIPIEFIFFFLLFHQSYKLSKYKWLPIGCLGLYLASWILDVVYFSKLQFSFYSFSYTIGNLLLLILIMGYFIRLVTSEAILNFRNDMLFWVSTGLLFYYLGTFPFYGLRNTLVTKYQDVYVTYVYIMYALNCLMYVMFSISFIWGKPRSTISSS